MNISSFNYTDVAAPPQDRLTPSRPNLADDAGVISRFSTSYFCPDGVSAVELVGPCHADKLSFLVDKVATDAVQMQRAKARSERFTLIHSDEFLRVCDNPKT